MLMNKELSTKIFALAHLIILILCLSLLGGLYIILNPEKFVKADLSKYIPVTSKPLSFNLEINNPEDDLLVFDNSLLISGTSAPHAAIVITTQDGDWGIEANSKGEFQQVIELSMGLNEINIKSFDEKGNEKFEERSIYYSKEELEE